MEVSGDTIALILSTSFGLWAVVVGWAANAVVKRIDRATDDLKNIDHQLREFVRVTEARLVRLETWQEAHIQDHFEDR